MAKLHPKMAARAAAVKASHAELTRTVPGFRSLPTKEQVRQTHQHVDRGVKRTR